MATAPQRQRDNNDNTSNAENPAVEASPPPPSLIYSAASTKLAGSTKDCAICLAEFAEGDAIRVMPACCHGFHASCIERWLAGGRHSSCPTCRAPDAVATAAAAGAGDYARDVAFVIMVALQLTALAFSLLETTMRYFRERK